MKRGLCDSMESLRVDDQLTSFVISDKPGNRLLNLPVGKQFLMMSKNIEVALSNSGG